ncbi:preprotein translocase subunit SecA [Mycoplasma seminis]|uniref:Protein translocase subunit SecA n=1 Tax=Mycoplasma seminis TaxID=512749 RepID=A0ABY9HAL9_9MOLU|nr:preprotein translocase subunit SecA [Mycoplasma seminis]WLP85630.1 preprotein translocase subunit SecA [Mycoplasma seminis]
MSNLNKLWDFKTTEMRIAEKSLKKINQLEPIVEKFSDEELKSKTQFFKDLLAKGYTLNDIRNDAFAVAREATKRILGKRPYDVQMLGGLLLDLGSVAEMKTGEGKTITSIAPVYLNALLGKGAIVSTVNEYLSERDAIEMGAVFNFLGLSVGINKAQMNTDDKRKAYAADITYSVHSELGFDYLRDNMVKDGREKVQRALQFCLIDEVDSILIDEAKTPLIISGGDAEDTSSYFAADQFVRTLNRNDYIIDEESKAVALTHSGIAKANAFYRTPNFYNIENSETVHLVQNALRAHKIMRIDVEYIVREGKIELVDAFTGRIMDGRSYSEGLQQAIQAKEMVEIEPENKTLATITYQNFFRMFKKLCGMTGTGKTEEQEFIDIYNMRVNVVPTNKPIARVDEPDAIFATAEDKWNAVVEKIVELYQKGQPVLVGTAQIEDSEIVHKMLLKKGIPHTVLNAKQNASEAEIISHAGEVASVTIATNMAGRGTDIKPTPEAIAKGGLYVLGTDKAESRRIDNQLRGRSGRQGDVGTSKFYVSIDDQLMQRFANYESFKEAYADSKGKEVTNKQLRFAFNHAQKKIEGFNYDSRKSVLNYDDVIRQQRDLIYAQRDLILYSSDIVFIVQRMIASSARSIVRRGEYKLHNNTYNYAALVNFLNENIGSLIKFNFDLNEISKVHESDLPEYIANIVLTVYKQWEENAFENASEEEILKLLKETILQTLDEKWQAHINKMDKLRSNVNLVQYSQKNPYQIYTEEGTKAFDAMIDDIAYGVLLRIFSNRIGIKSMITKEMRSDPVFKQILATMPMDPYKSIQEQEQTLIDIYNSIKRRLEEIEQEKIQQEAKMQEALNQSIQPEIVDNTPSFLEMDAENELKKQQEISPSNQQEIKKANSDNFIAKNSKISYNLYMENSRTRDNQHKVLRSSKLYPIRRFSNRPRKFIIQYVSQPTFEDKDLEEMETDMKRCLRCSKNFRNCKHVRQWKLTAEEFEVFNKIPVIEEVAEEVIIEKIKNKKPVIVEEIVSVVKMKCDCGKENCACPKDECKCLQDEANIVRREQEIAEAREKAVENVKEVEQELKATKEEEAVVEKVTEENNDEFLSMETREENVMQPVGGACCGGNCKANENANNYHRPVDEKKSKCAILAYQERLAAEKETTEACPAKEECAVETVAVAQEECKCYTLDKVAQAYVDYFAELKNRL